MAIRKEGSSFAVSNNLKTALVNAGLQQVTLPQPGLVVVVLVAHRAD